MLAGEDPRLDRLTFLKKEWKDPSQNPHAVESLIEVNIVGGLNDLTKLGGGLSEEGGQILEPLIPEPPRRLGGDEFEHLLGRRGDLPQLVPEFGIVRRNVHLDKGRDGLPELFPGCRGSHTTRLFSII